MHMMIGVLAMHALFRQHYSIHRRDTGDMMVV